MRASAVHRATAQEYCTYSSIVVHSSRICVLRRRYATHPVQTAGVWLVYNNCNACRPPGVYMRHTHTPSAAARTWCSVTTGGLQLLAFTDGISAGPAQAQRSCSTQHSSCGRTGRYTCLAVCIAWPLQLQRTLAVLWVSMSVAVTVD